MNYKMILKVLGRLLMINSGLMVFPIIVSLVYQESLLNVFSFLGIAIFSLLLGFFMSRVKPTTTNLYTKEGFIIVALTWIILSLVGALPAFISREIPSLADAIFESTSGFTTTGMTILNDVELLSHSTLFWRSFTQFLGGIGVLVFTIAFLPKSDRSYAPIIRAEETGPRYGNVIPSIRRSTKYLFIIYLLMALLTFIALNIVGMPFFESLIHTFGVAGTGGFSMYNENIIIYNSPAVEAILAISMVLFGINFNLFFIAITKELKQALKNEELKWYLGILLIASLFITLNLVTTHYGSLIDAFHYSFFSASSMMSSTGIELVPFVSWPTFSRLILIFIMFVGGMAGSTSGGFKVSRIAIVIKSLFSELKRTVFPNRVVTVRFNGEPIEKETIAQTSRFLVLYMFIIFSILLLVTFEIENLTVAFSTVIGTFNNIGLSLAAISPGASLADISDWAKYLLSFAMLTGRLEIYPMIILLSPSVWKNYS